VDASDPAAVKFAWSGTGFIATVNGTKVSAKLTSEGSDAFYQPVIDGTPGARFKIASGATQTAVLGTGLAAGDHTVELYRETEGMYGNSVFGGIIDGTVKTPPAGSGRLIEFIGDSISCGYGNLGVEVHPPWDNACGFTLDTEAVYQAYDMMIGRTLNAEVSIIARSGWGVYRDGGGSTAGVLSSVYDNTLGTSNAVKWDFARKPDAVLMDLGTNDSATGAGGDPGKPYEDATVAMVQTIRCHYPNAWIFLTMGPMTGDPLLTAMQAHITNAVTRLADPKVVGIKMPVQDVTHTGCDYHPDVVTDKSMADLLAPLMKAKLGW
jgi:lysophospholipase L1-like esterase